MLLVFQTQLTERLSFIKKAVQKNSPAVDPSPGARNISLAVALTIAKIDGNRFVFVPGNFDDPFQVFFTGAGRFQGLDNGVGVGPPGR